MAPLATLPDELIALIAGLLEQRDAIHFRSSSRKVEEACFDHFARRFFRKRGFMITTDSLGVLDSISQHHGLRTYVQHVWFNPDCFTFVMNSREFVNKSSRTISQYQADHAALLNDTALQMWLIRIFSRLPNLKTLGMRRGTEHKPWGWSTMQYAAGQDPRILGPFACKYPQMVLEPSLLFVAMLKALASSRMHVRRFYTDAIIEKAVCSLLSHDGLERACHSIQYLEINLIGTLPESDPPHSTSRRTEEGATGALLRDMLQAMPDLRELGMTLFHDFKQRHMVPPTSHDLQSWRQAYPFKALHNVANNSLLTQLRRIKLEKICTTQSTLTSFLRLSSKTLMSIKLRHIHLLSDKHIVRNEEQISCQPWHQFFTFLTESCRELEYVLLHWLSVDGTTVRFQPSTTAVTRESSGAIDVHEVLVPALGQVPIHEVLIPALGQLPIFADYDNLTVEVFGRDDVHKRLTELVDAHWSGTRLVTYAMDDMIWHTDTSDEDW